MAGDNQQFCLRWNNHQSTLISVFDTLLESGTLVDCTLAAEGQFLKAHKVVLCACSPYLEILLSQHYEKHPIVILKDIKFQELKSMMDYMYRGEVNISQDQLSTFLKAAESLQIKGLTDGGGNEDGAASSAPAKAPIATPVRKQVQQSVPRTSAAAQGLTIERRPDSPHIRSRDESASPTPRKRRRNQRRPSTSDDPDSHIDTSNSCDVPPLQSGALSGVGVPNIPATITKGAPLDDGDHETENSRINNHDASAAEGVAGPKIEPTGELIEPKTEYMEEMNNEDSIEDLTLDDDDDMDNNSMDMSRAGPSHDNSNQSFGQWPMSANQTDEVFMNAQEAVGAHRDTQDDGSYFDYDADFHSTGRTTDGAKDVVNPIPLESNEKAVSLVGLENNEEAVNQIVFENNEGVVNSIELENNEEAVNSIALEKNEKGETLSVRVDPKLWVKPVDVLFTDQIKEEIPEIEYQTIVDIKDEIEDEVEEAEVKIEESEIISKLAGPVEEAEVKIEESEMTPEPAGPPPFIEIPLPKVAIPKLHQTIAKRGVKNRKIVKTRNRTILPMTQPITHVNTSHLEPATAPHQIIMPSSQMSGIAYQIFLGDHSKNSNNPVQYTMLQPQPLFLQPTPTSVSSSSSVVMSQPSMVINQPFHMTQAQIQPSTKIPQIASHRRVTRSRRSSCSFCYKLFNDINEHLKECWLNPDSKRYKFRKIAPSTSI